MPAEDAFTNLEVLKEIFVIHVKNLGTSCFKTPIPIVQKWLQANTFA